MYSRFLRIIEKIFVFLVQYIVPITILIAPIFGYLRFFSPMSVQRFLARFGRRVLVFLLFIKPITVITKRYFHATYRKLPEGITYLLKGWTQDPILIYIRHLLIDTVYSLSLYFMRRRKQLGILVFRSIFSHRIFLEIIRYQQGAPFLFMSRNLFVWTGIIGLIALFIGFSTSNISAMKILRHRRKHIQRIAYLAFLGACVHLFFFSHDRSYIVVFGIFVLLKIREWIPVKGQPTVLEKAETSKDIPDTMAARVINHRHLTPQVLEYTVEIRQELSVIPGQRALFSREDKDGKFNRAYSIADREIDEGKTLLTFTVKIGGGRGTTLLSAVKIGDTLYVKGIFGKFVLQQTDLPKVFIGTGTGLSPLINMAIHCDVKEKTLFYSVPYQKDLFYEDKIKRIHDLTYEIYLTREDVKGYKFGRLDLKKLAFTKNTEFYVCGNPSIVDQIVQELRSLGYQHIFSEKF